MLIVTYEFYCACGLGALYSPKTYYLGSSGQVLQLLNSSFPMESSFDTNRANSTSCYFFNAMWKKGFFPNVLIHKQIVNIGLMSVLLKRLSMFLPNVLWVYSFIKEVHFFKSACYVVVLRSVPIDKILSVKNARAWVSMVSYF